MRIIVIFFCIYFNLHICWSDIDTTNTLLINNSEKFIELIQKKEFEKASEYFDGNMKDAFPVEKFESTWKNIEIQVGKMQEIVNKEISIFNEKQIVVFTGKFEKMYLDIRMVYVSDNKIGGFFLAPNYDYSIYKTPKYANINDFDEQQVTFGKKGWELKGILSIPRKLKDRKSEIFPVVILVHGSGPQDMDESIGPNKPFKDLAWGLATKRIAVFRYNKRTKEHPGQVVEQLPEFSVWQETIDDVMEAIKKMINMPDIDPRRIYILGHSLGGMVIPRIAEKDKALAGFVIMAGNARPLQEIIIDQYKYLFELDEEVSDEEKEQLDTLMKQIERINNKDLNKDTPISLLPIGTPAPYWLDLKDYFPAQKAKEISSRILILQGERDYQVTVKDFEIWKGELSEKKNVQFKLYPKLNHIFMEGEGKSLPEEYTNENHIPEYVIDDIVKFILRKY